MTRKFLVKVHYRTPTEDFRISQIVEAKTVIDALGLVVERFNLAIEFVVVVNVGPEDKP